MVAEISTCLLCNYPSKALSSLLAANAAELERMKVDRFKSPKKNEDEL